MSIKTILVPAGGSDSATASLKRHWRWQPHLLRISNSIMSLVDALEAATTHATCRLCYGRRPRQFAFRIRASEHQQELPSSCTRPRRNILPQKRNCYARQTAGPEARSRRAGAKNLVTAYRVSCIAVRCSDLVVMGRSKHCNHLPENLLDRLFARIGPSNSSSRHPKTTIRSHDTIMVCWKECREAVHADHSRDAAPAPSSCKSSSSPFQEDGDDKGAWLPPTGWHARCCGTGSMPSLVISRPMGD